MTEQGSPPRRSARQPDLGRRGYDRPPPDRPRADRQNPERLRPDRQRPERQHRPDRHDRPAGWDSFGGFGPDTDTDTELPPWAGPSVHPTRPGGARLRPPVPRPAVDDEPGYADPWAGDERPEWPDEVPAASPAAVPRTGRRAGRRAAAARLRRSRRRILRWSGVAIGACVIAAAVIALVGRNSPARLPYVTSLQKGEFKSVPDACKVLSPATLSKFLPGPRSAVEPMKSSTFSQCSFTLDSKPNFLVLTVSAESFAPFAAASDNGSASGNARDSFTAARGLLAKPAKHSPLPRATIAPLTGLGQHAFAGIQHEHTGGIMREVATVAVLYRNVIITVTMSGQESGGYGPVAIGTLQGDAQTIARLVLKQELSQPTA